MSISKLSKVLRTANLDKVMKKEVLNDNRLHSYHSYHR